MIPEEKFNIADQRAAKWQKVAPTPPNLPPSHTPHFTLYTLHFTRHTRHFTLYTVHSTLYTPHFTLHTPDSTMVLLQSYNSIITYRYI